MRIRAQRWPWQGERHWMGRFGGGWNYKLGIDIGSSSVIINLIWGLIRIEFK